MRGLTGRLYPLIVQNLKFRPSFVRFVALYQTTNECTHADPHHSLGAPPFACRLDTAFLGGYPVRRAKGSWQPLVTLMSLSMRLLVLAVTDGLDEDLQGGEVYKG